MAQNDVGLFNSFLDNLGKAEMNLDTDTIRVGLVDSTVTPTATTSAPSWGSAGTNMETNELTAGGNYIDNGTDISSTYSGSGATATFDGTNITWSQNASNPTDARWGIIYNDTDADNKCIGWVDLGADFDMTTGDLVFTWNASGIFTIS